MKERFYNFAGIAFLILFQNNCYSHFRIQKQSLPEYTSITSVGSKKVALIGFDQYKYSVKYLNFYEAPKNARAVTRGNFQGDRFYRIASGVPDVALMNSFGIGRDLSNFPKAETQEESINYYTEQNFKSIEEEYYAKALQSNIYHKLFLRSNNGRFYDRDIDYYVLAINFYPFQRSTLMGGIAMTGSLLLSIVTFNFVPIVDYQTSYTKYLIYGKYFNLLDELEVENEYFVYHSLWKRDGYSCVIYDEISVAGARPQPRCIWEVNLKEGQDFVRRFLEEKSSM